MDVLLSIGICLMGLIDPKFTPVHLTHQSIAVIELNLSLSNEKTLEVETVKNWKGSGGNDALTMTLRTAVEKTQAEDIVQILSQEKPVQTVFFIGGETGDASTALLHIQGIWYNFELNEQVWGMTDVNSDMSPTWDGGTDMLIKAVAYIVSSDDPYLPVEEGVGWVDLDSESDPDPFAQLGSSVNGAQSVYFDAARVLHVSSGDGDRLFTYDAESGSMIDITEKYKLNAVSKVSTWLDINADGKLDLITWNDRLRMHLQTAVGFQEQVIPETQPSITSCYSLTPVGHSGNIIISTDHGPKIWSPAQHSIMPIADHQHDVALGKAGLCLVADFDNDNRADVLQLYQHKAVVYAGSDNGAFRNSTIIDVAQDDDEFNAFVGDFDADGLLDFFTVGPNQKTKLWNNRGGFTFKNEFEMTGEMTAKGPEDAISGTACDFNNDGRQDVVFFYDMGSPRMLFSRGFRTFGLANGMDMSLNGFIEESLEGAQAGCVADFNGDGCQDMVVIHVSGNAHFLPISNGDDTVGCVHVALDKKLHGPIRITAWQDDRCLGAHNIGAGNREGFIGQSEAGPMLLKWQRADGTENELEIIVENEPQRVVLD